MGRVTATQSSPWQVRFGLNPSMAEWVESRLGTDPTPAMVDQLERDPRLTGTQRQIVDAIRRSMVGLRTNPSVGYNKGGRLDAGAHRGWTLRTAKVPTRNLSAEQRFRAELSPFLIGQDTTFEEFDKIRNAYESPVKQAPPMLVIGGEEGHGKDDALKGFAMALLKDENSTVITVDLSNAVDDDHDKLFEAGSRTGDLSVPRLMEIQDQKLGIVHLKGLNQLKDRAPRIAETLLRRLSTRPGSDGHVWVPFVLDFDASPGTKLSEELMASLGRAAVILRKAEAQFQLLDQEAMDKYLDIAIPQLIQGPGLGKLTIEFDEEARSLFTDILATPLLPLDQIGPRLEALILNRVEDWGLVPEDGILRVHLLKGRSQGELEDLAKKMKDPAFDLLKAPILFTVAVEGRNVEPKVVEALVANSERVVDQLLQRSNHWGTEVARLFPEFDQLAELDDALGKTLTQLRARARAPGLLALNPGQGESLADLAKEISRISAQLVRTGADRQAEVGMNFTVNLEVALQAVAEAVTLIGKSPLLLKGEEPRQAALRAYQNNLKAAIDNVSRLRSAVTDAGHDENRLTQQLQLLAQMWTSALEKVKDAKEEAVYPLVVHTDAEALIDTANAIRAQLPAGPLREGEKPSPIRRVLEANKEGKADCAAIDRLLEVSVEVAQSLGGLSPEQQRSVLDLYREEMADSDSQRRNIARELVRTENGAGRPDALVLVAELVKLPVGALRRLQQTKVPIYAVRGKITDFLKQLPKGSRPPGYPEGTTYDDVPAIFVPKGAEGNDRGSMIVIVTKEVNGVVTLPGLDPKRGQNSVLHECLHGLDLDNFYSTKPEFVAARDAELAVLSEYEKQGKEGNFDRGLAETWAITGERLYGKDATVKKERPLLVGTLEKLLAFKEIDP